ncbi:DeoR family fructose operon transcriptional repressor [Scopulibacillus daqui]|uniref:DeoR family fructose operon transcriptional repressor n=1 Tax=Scopulibacillus daqui TaxID=1469162 RepID=A0ABS2Q4B7_9BACL|nr:DeoR/GlpR family DNA-binding transcription regulator [Scopulibacillus daqui]MBM7646680.1 DeoR family fructose operon transcriptional repressor [Scopulibacillus daqui]
MLTPERHRLILELIKENKIVTIHQLVEATKSSESTIRRDLIQLENENKLARFHGGAQIIKSKSEETSIGERLSANFTEKKAIAKKAAAYVENGDCIFLDAGTTTYYMIEYLPKETIVVTNGLSLINECLDKGLETYTVGGRAKAKTRAFIGKGALEGINAYRFDKCFIGINGIHLKFGYTTPDPEEAMIKKAAIDLANKAYVLADWSKFNQVSFSFVHNLDSASIITDRLGNQEEIKQFSQITTIETVKS